MPDLTSSRLPELMQSIEAAWTDLHSFLAGLTESQMMDVIDDQGWNIKDHITHMSVWEESVLFLFQGKPRHNALGIDQSLYDTASFDEINAIIRDQRKYISLTSVIGEFRKVHSGLMESIQALSDTDLNEKVREFFPQPPANDDRRVVDIIYDNTTHHFLQHLSWMKALLNYQD